MPNCLTSVIIAAALSVSIGVGLTLGVGGFDTEREPIPIPFEKLIAILRSFATDAGDGTGGGVNKCAMDIRNCAELRSVPAMPAIRTLDGDSIPPNNGSAPVLT